MRITALATIALSLGWAGGASASVGGDAARLRAIWTTFGKVEQLTPRLLERGTDLPILISPELLDLKSRDCVSVAVLGTTSSHFVLHLASRGSGPPSPSDWPVSSVAGGAELTRCGMNKLALLGLTIEMRSPRAVLETLVVRSSTPAPSIVRVLPHRDPGPMTLPVGPGHKLSSTPLADRKRRIEERGGREAARNVVSSRLPSRVDGSGETLLDMPEGCHRVDLLSETGVMPNGRAEDVDMELALVAHGERVAVDRADSPDATASFCLGEETPIRLRFVGARPNANVTLLRTHWDLPDGLPEKWGAATRGKMAGVVREHGAMLSGQPIYESLGVQGLTSLSVETRPGACYTAAVVALRGSALGLHLAARSGNTGAENRALREGDGTVIAFCATSNRLTFLEIESRGLGLAWLLSVWETGTIRIGEVSP